jgi:hypothetical protein
MRLEIDTVWLEITTSQTFLEALTCCSRPFATAALAGSLALAGAAQAGGRRSTDQSTSGDAQTPTDDTLKGSHQLPA